MAQGPSVLVVGAGIAGLAVAAALSSAGCGVQVLERRDDLADVGAGITLWPNALAALDQLGVGAAVRQASQPVLSAGLRRPDGSWRHRMDPEVLVDALGEPLAVIGRGELLRILEGAAAPVAVRYGAEAASWRSAADHVEVQLVDGRVVTAEGAVAADGLRSVLARHLDGRLAIRYAGYTAWRGVAPLPLGDVPAGETWGPGAEFGYLPMTDGRTYWFATRNLPEHHDPGVDVHTYLRQRFGTWHEPIPSLIAATAADAILRNDIYDRTPFGPWSKGRMVLAGDAAHPMRPHLGQGGCQALEDAAVLAASVAASPDDLPTAFARYERARRRRVRRMVRQSALLGRIIQKTGPLPALGRTLVAGTPDALAVRMMARTAGRAASPV